MNALQRVRVPSAGKRGFFISSVLHLDVCYFAVKSRCQLRVVVRAGKVVIKKGDIFVNLFKRKKCFRGTY